MCKVCGQSRKGCRRGVCRPCTSRAVVGKPGQVPRSTRGASRRPAKTSESIGSDFVSDLFDDGAISILGRLAHAVFDAIFN